MAINRKSIFAGAVGGLLALYAAYGFYSSRTPEALDPLTSATEHVGTDVTRDNLPPSGAVFTSTLIELVDTMMDKNGGYQSNDVAVKLGLYDNMAHFELGAIYMIRDAANILRTDFSRSQSQSQEDPDLKEFVPKLSFDSDSWILPSTESRYQEASNGMKAYLKRMVDPAERSTQFYTRADNLVKYLDVSSQRLGSLSQALVASVGQERVNTDLAGDKTARATTYTGSETVARTPWLEIDDNFYEARGSLYALIALYKAIRVDFYEVLEDKNALASIDQIIREMEETQEIVWSPVILNGSGFGFVANHSLAMASYIGRANAAIIDLKELLAKG
tara:strand:+ start:367 stop:1365 length:999 start_codon:yes stop_codon:yes gene_type:complete